MATVIARRAERHVIKGFSARRTEDCWTRGARMQPLPITRSSTLSETVQVRVQHRRSRGRRHVGRGRLRHRRAQRHPGLPRPRRRVTNDAARGCAYRGPGSALSRSGRVNCWKRTPSRAACSALPSATASRGRSPVIRETPASRAGQGSCAEPQRKGQLRQTDPSRAPRSAHSSWTASCAARPGSGIPAPWGLGMNRIASRMARPVHAEKTPHCTDSCVDERGLTL